MNVGIVKIGNTWLALPAEHMPGMFDALSEAREVSHDGWYGNDKNYILMDDDGEPFEFKLVDESRIVKESKDER